MGESSKPFCKERYQNEQSPLLINARREGIRA